jgi:hypothetical protein
MKKIILILFLVSPVLSQAQNLPHWMTEEEKLQLPSYLLNNSMIRDANPPPFAPRAMAEWEEIQGLLVTWTDYTSIIRQIIDYAQEECTVYIVCSDSEAVKSNLSTNGVPLTNLKFLKYGFNSIWCRDYGQWNVYSDDANDLSLIDWIYNRPRPKDDTIPQQLAADFRMQHRRYGHRCRIHRTAQLLNVPETSSLEFLGNLGGSRGVPVEHTG